MLIVEVLSPSNEGYARGKKFELYRTIPSFQEYLVVHRDERYVEHYSKLDDGGWRLRDYKTGTVPVPRLQLEISLDDLYADAAGLD